MLHLVGRGGLVDRHGDGAGEPHGLVEDGPRVGGGGEQAHPVPGLDAAGDEAGRHGAHLGEERGEVDVHPAARAVAHGVHGGVRPVGTGGDDQVRDVGVRRRHADELGGGLMDGVLILHGPRVSISGRAARGRHTRARDAAVRSSC
ncbi:Uncharacterised protein [Streptococcus pneumoniae]|nr:Uncharacterised protein [Streptococcus pneumoniae]